MVLDDFNLSKTSDQPRAPLADGRGFEPMLASPIDRLAANVADFVIFFPMLALVTSVFSRFAKEAQLVGNDTDWSLWIAASIGIGFMSLVVYQAVSVAVWGATPGKIAMRLRVVSVWNGAKPRPMEAFLRAVVWTSELLLFGIPFIAVYSNERRRPFHDRIGDTVVVALNRKKQYGMARFAELSIASGFQSAALAIFALFVAVHLSDFKARSAKSQAAIQKEEADGRLCAEVREELEETPGKDANSYHDRLVAAITLFAADDLDSDCLDSEAEFALWKNQERPLAYLAKALSVPDEDKEESYFDKACPAESEGSDVCKMVSLTRTIESLNEPDPEHNAREARDQQAENEAAFDQLVAQLEPTSSAYLRVMTVRHLMAVGEYARALDLGSLSIDSHHANVFMAKQRAMALFGVGRKKEARASMRSAVDLLDSKARVEISRWFCSTEIYNDGCTTESAQACDILDRAVEKSEHWLARPEVATAYIHDKTCRGPNTPDAWRALADKMPVYEGKTYVEAMALLSENKKPEAVAKLKSLTDPTLNERGAFFLEASARLVEIAVSAKEVALVTSSWNKMDPAEEIYRALGQSIIRKLNGLKAWDQALAVGLKLSKNNRFDRDLFEQMVLAAHGAGDKAMALVFLDKIAALQPSDSNRAPASAESFESVARELLQDRNTAEEK